jgi:NADH-quinone oxidoreductase subunit N
MLALAGFPATAGFFGKVYLIEAAVDNGYAWLGVVIVVGSAVSLAYYLRVVAAVWMRSASESLTVRRPAMAGGSPEADDEARAAGREPGSVAVHSVELDEPLASTRRLFQPEVVFVAVVCAVATIAIGVYPEPLFNVARDAGDALRSLL